MRHGRRLACVAGQASGAAHGQLRRGYCSEAEGRRQSGTNAGGGAGAGPRQPAPSKSAVRVLQRRVAVAGCPSPSRSTTSPRRHCAPRAPAGASRGRTDGLARLPGPTSSSSCCTSAHRLAGYTAITHPYLPSLARNHRRRNPATQAGHWGAKSRALNAAPGWRECLHCPTGTTPSPLPDAQIMENYDAERPFRPCPQSSASYLAKHLPPPRCTGCSCARRWCTVHSDASAS